MKKAILLPLLALLSLSVIAQVDVGQSSVPAQSDPLLCLPGVQHKSPSKGVAIHYTFNPNFQMRAPGAENSQRIRANERYGGKLKIPILNRSNVKFMLGFKYNVEKYSFTDINPENYPLFQHLSESTLRKSEAAAYLVLPINHKYYTSFRLSTGFQGDYGGFVNLDSRYAVYRAAGMFGVKKSQDLEYGIGLLYSKNIRQGNLLPFGFVNYTFNDKWGLEAAIPANIKIRHNIAEGKIALLGLEYSSQSYTLNLADPKAGPISQTEPTPMDLFHFRRSSIQATASYMHQTSDWTWLEFKLGYAFDLRSQARDLDVRHNYSLRPTGSIVGTVTFFISPPKKYMKACPVKK